MMIINAELAKKLRLDSITPRKPIREYNIQELIAHDSLIKEIEPDLKMAIIDTEKQIDELQNTLESLKYSQLGIIKIQKQIANAGWEIYKKSRFENV